MKIVINLVACIGAIFLMSYILTDQIVFDSPMAVIIAGTILWLVNTVVRPLIKLVTLPLTIITLGLFSLVINTLMVMLTDYIVPGVSLGGFWAALLLALVVSLLQVLLSGLYKDKK